MMKPPSTILKEEFNSLKEEDPSESLLEEVAKKTLLPVNEVILWFDHLKTVQTNRKRGAQKAAATRRLKKQTASTSTSRYFCSCGEEYLDFTDEVEQWIGCDNCNQWYHCECVNVAPSSIPDSFVCPNCTC